MAEFNVDEVLERLLDVESPPVEMEYDGFGDPTPPKNPHLVTPADERGAKETSGNINQWAIAGNGVYLPVGSTASVVPAGVYAPYSPSPGQVGLQHMPVNSDGIYKLPDMETEKVLQEMESFWNNEHLYRKHNLLYKRGILLFGPPGSGKTITVKLLMQELMRRNGLIVICQHVGLCSQALKLLRKIEPKRNIIVVFEDIDEIINYNGEASVLSLLDGEHNIDNVLNIATTNFPDRLGARIINRPSRFDSRVLIGMPGPDARAAYLGFTTHNALQPKELKKWVKESDGMSLAHLRELVAAVYCLGQPYDVVIDRLKKMGEPPVLKGDGFNKPNNMGFGGKAKQESSGW